MTSDQVIAALKRKAKKSVKDGMARFAIPSDRAFGVMMRDLHAIARLKVCRTRFIHTRDGLPCPVRVDPQEWVPGSGQVAGIHETLGDEAIERRGQGGK